jgi:iron complex transport system substrate-binding protein
MRIVSLLPSATEILCAIGLEDQLVGVTHECDYPASVLRLPKVTRTLIPATATSAEIDALVRERMVGRNALYTLDLPVLRQLRPDLIVTQALCDVCAVAEDEVRDAACALASAPAVLNLEPETLDGVLASIADTGIAAHAEEEAERLVASLRARVDAVAVRTASERMRPRVALLEWIDPPFSAGHWNPELVRLAGGVDGLGREGRKSVTLRWQQVIDWNPEVVLISCCGFSTERAMQDVPVLDRVPGWNTLPAVQSERVYVTDGSAYFSRPGPRLVDSLELLGHVVHPDVNPLPSWVQPPVRVARRAVATSRRLP